MLEKIIGIAIGIAIEIENNDNTNSTFGFRFLKCLSPSYVLKLRAGLGAPPYENHLHCSNACKNVGPASAPAGFKHRLGA
jgi:hypothetical protein